MRMTNKYQRLDINELMISTTLPVEEAITGRDLDDYSFLKGQPVPERYSSSLSRYKIFCCLWAIGSLFHMANLNSFSVNLTLFLFSLSAIALLVKPSSMIRLFIFIIIQMYQVFLDLPSISNHWLLVTFVNLTIIQAYLYLSFKHRSFHVDKAKLLDTFAPLVKLELLALYFFAVFHKLNTGFFDTNDSCAVRFLILQSDYYNIPYSKTLLTLNIYLTIAIETLIPLLICFRRTRYWGILIGLIFHCILAYNPLNGFYDFSATVFALYFLFTNVSFSEKIEALTKRIQEGKAAIKYRMNRFNLVSIILFIVPVAFILIFAKYYNQKGEDYFRDVIWTAFSVTYIGVFISTMRSKEQRQEAKAFSIAHFSLLIFPLIAFLNGFCPYLGLKTETSYAMFSNLRTEGGVTNHFFMPLSAQVFDFQKDVVEIVSSTDPHLQNLAKEHKLMVFFEFRRYVRKNGIKQVTYLQNGERKSFDIANASYNHDLLQKSSYPLEKLFLFRSFNKYGVPACLH